MSFNVERLYELLPAIYRLRDTELATLRDSQQGGPLKSLLAVIAEQAAVLEEDLAQLYDDQFIETCAEWVIPYIGDLVGVRGLFAFPNARFSQRAQVANTIAYRRRKGTAALLEQLARDLTGWSASVVEYFQLLATTQYLNHTRLENLSFADLRHSERLEYLNTPFDRTAHTADVRRIESGRGRYNIPHVGIFLWRLESFSVTLSPANKLDDRCYRFDALGRDVQLYNRPVVETEISHLAEPVNVPMPLCRRVLDQSLETYYGAGKSLLVYRDGKAVPLNEVRVCDLSDVTDSSGKTIWAHTPQDKVTIDPVLGRIAFPPQSPPESPPRNVHVTYHYGFSFPMGGGEYEREIGSSGAEKIIRVPSPEGPTLQAAMDALITALAGDSKLDGGVVQIEKPIPALASTFHSLSGGVNVPEGKRIILRAVDEHRPIILLGGDLEFKGGAESEIELNGLLIVGGRLRVPVTRNQLHSLRLVHCTLPPSGEIRNLPVGSATGIVAESPDVRIEIVRSIVSTIRAVDTAHVCLSGSIVDASGDSEVAYAGIGGQQAGRPLVAVNTTIIGRVHTLMMELASNTIFFATSAMGPPVRADQLQTGCVRFCYVPPGSMLPRPFQCQPRTFEDAASVRPLFTSLRWGDAGYCQLSIRASEKIRRGADDEAEMGVFHDLYQPQRESNLRTRLDEYLRFGLEAGIIYAS